jgi:hypothetical protein
VKESNAVSKNLAHDEQFSFESVPSLAPNLMCPARHRMTLYYIYKDWVLRGNIVDLIKAHQVFVIASLV